MPTITCQHTGVQFEAKSNRAKNHPVISAVLEEANRVGRYGLALDAIRAARAEGVTDITEYQRRAKLAVAGDVQKVMDSRREADEKREAEKRARQERNAHLRAHGYTWSKEYADFDEYEEGEPSQWVLFSPDRRPVSVAQALDEIERGAEVVLAEIAQAEAEAEQARQAYEAEPVELAARVQAATGLAKEPADFSWDDFRFGLGATLDETPHFAAREYKFNDKVIGFVIKKKAGLV